MSGETQAPSDSRQPEVRREDDGGGVSSIGTLATAAAYACFELTLLLLSTDLLLARREEETLELG